MAKKRKPAIDLSWWSDGEERQSRADWRHERMKQKKQETANLVYKDRDLGGGIGDRIYYPRNPYGAGSRGISPSALRRVSENKQATADRRAQKRNAAAAKRKVPKKK